MASVVIEIDKRGAYVEVELEGVGRSRGADEEKVAERGLEGHRRDDD